MDNLDVIRKQDLYEIHKDVMCPVCGFNCLGNGGIGCIDKPALCGLDKDTLGEINNQNIKRLNLGILKRYLHHGLGCEKDNKNNFRHAVEWAIKEMEGV
ncbi:MAG: hypothetical protein KKC68_06670 [Candidatus Thermoplasmatota archaeon]|nr:hypothetical protein [Candidatus Thermoplasmatota archaeon]